VSGRHVCFYGRGTKLIIPWVEVSSLARTAAENGSAIYLATSGGEVSHACGCVCCVCVCVCRGVGGTYRNYTCSLPHIPVHIHAKGPRPNADDDEGDLAHDVGQHGAQGDG
jgi:hypothetical protein